MAKSFFFKTQDDENLYVKFFPALLNSGLSERLHAKERPTILFIHGAIENGRIFYSASGKGLAPYLASNGFDCYVLDLRGHGKSTPPIDQETIYGQTEVILQDIPLVINSLCTQVKAPIQIVAHSWGGVLSLATLARFPHLAEHVKSMVFLGTKRSVQVSNFEKLLKVSFAWNFLSPILTQVYGYLPAREWRMGSDSESKKAHAQSKLWVNDAQNWNDPEDNFDYKDALSYLQLPPILSVMGTKDLALGHIQDARYFLKEANAKNAECLEVPFGHIDMLTSDVAVRELFPRLVKWLQN